MTPEALTSADAIALQELIGRCHEALSHQSQGRPEPFLDLWSRADDVTIMAAIGGYHVGFEQVRRLLIAASKTRASTPGMRRTSSRRSATTSPSASSSSVYGRTVDGEHEEMTLRATQIYRHEDGAWKVIHRHGDVLTPVEAKW
jgi:ketosteroid isomerase-like protein